MSWEKKDLIQITNFINVLNSSARFDNMSVQDNVKLTSSFAWLDALKTKIEQGVNSVPMPVLPDQSPVEETPSVATKKSSRKRKK